MKLAVWTPDYRNLKWKNMIHIGFVVSEIWQVKFVYSSRRDYSAKYGITQAGAVVYTYINQAINQQINKK